MIFELSEPIFRLCPIPIRLRDGRDFIEKRGDLRPHIHTPGPEVRSPERAGRPGVEQCRAGWAEAVGGGDAARSRAPTVPTHQLQRAIDSLPAPARRAPGLGAADEVKQGSYLGRQT